MVSDNSQRKCNSGMITAATQDTSLQALLTVSHSLSLANDCPTSLSLLKDNATSCNPALPSGHGQCNVLQSSPTSGFFSLSPSLHFAGLKSVHLSTSLLKLKSTTTVNKMHTATLHVSDICNTCNPVQSKMSIHKEFLNNSVPKNPNTSNYFTASHCQTSAALLLTRRATHSLHYQWLPHWVVHKLLHFTFCSLSNHF